ncbi:hypothetical protein [Aurantimonas aggregata]
MSIGVDAVTQDDKTTCGPDISRRGALHLTWRNGVETMAENDAAYVEVEERIRAVRDNIRDLVEQASAASGEAAEQRIADRLSEQEALLERLIQERDGLAGPAAQP